MQPRGDQPGKTDWVKEVQICAVNGQLFELTVHNKSASTDFFIQIFDVAAKTDIDESTVPEYDVAVGAGGFTPFSWENGRQFANGIYARAVTTQGGSTAITDADAKFTWNASYPWPIS